MSPNNNFSFTFVLEKCVLHIYCFSITDTVISLVAHKVH